MILLQSSESRFFDRFVLYDIFIIAINRIYVDYVRVYCQVIFSKDFISLYFSYDVKFNVHVALINLEKRFADRQHIKYNKNVKFNDRYASYKQCDRSYEKESHCSH